MSTREIEIEVSTPAVEWKDLPRDDQGPFFAIKKFAVKQKVISFETDDGDRITFQKGVRHKGLDDFQVTVHKVIHETKQCSMGCYHKTGKQVHEYVRFHMEWDHVLAFVEWVQSGSWSQVRNKGM